MHTHDVTISCLSADSILPTDLQCGLAPEAFDLIEIARLCSGALREPVDPKDLNVVAIPPYGHQTEWCEGDNWYTVCAFVTIGDRIVRISYDA